MSEPNIAQRLFDGDQAECDLEDVLLDAGVTFEKLGWDHYDCSLEIYGVPPNDRLSEDAQKAIHAAGFCKAYVNHADKWETHYGFNPNESFVVSKGWRVSYPHKRGDGGNIMVEEVVKGWLDDWFKSGYVVVIDETKV